MDSLKPLLIDSSSEEMTAALAATLARSLAGGACVGLSGTLGAGKSVFARGFARALGIDGLLPSPSYPIILEYPGNPGLCHMDWYRLFDESELEETGVAEYLGVAPWICLVEWWNKFPGYLPDNALLVQLDITGPTRRSISIRLAGDAGQPGQQAILDRLRQDLATSATTWEENPT